MQFTIFHILIFLKQFLEPILIFSVIVLLFCNFKNKKERKYALFNIPVGISHDYDWFQKVLGEKKKILRYYH